MPVKECDSIKNEDDRGHEQQSLKGRAVAQQQDHRATEAKQQSEEQNDRPRHASAEDDIHQEAHGSHAKKSRCQKILETADGQILKMAAEPIDARSSKQQPPQHDHNSKAQGHPKKQWFYGHQR